mmetsp:Transcript_20036/g.34143  ORF Transcript_20036/g.34143 Transcript_20036/m.34143 type:complete len:93 (+) Transcript_20036:73-351(+)
MQKNQKSCCNNKNEMKTRRLTCGGNQGSSWPKIGLLRSSPSPDSRIVPVDALMRQCSLPTTSPAPTVNNDRRPIQCVGRHLHQNSPPSPSLS